MVAAVPLGGLGKKEREQPWAVSRFFLSTLLSSEHIALAQEFVSSVVDTSSPEKELIKRRVYTLCNVLYPMHFALRSMGALSGIKDFGTFLSFSPHPNISDGNFKLVPHCICIDLLGSKST